MARPSYLAVLAAAVLCYAALGAVLRLLLLLGAGEGVMMSAAVLWLLRLAGPARRGQAHGHIGLANYAGLTLGPLLASSLGLVQGRVFLEAALLPAAGVLVAIRARRAPTQESSSAGRAAPAGVLVPGVALMLVNVGYVALLAFGGAAAGLISGVPRRPER